MRHVTHTGSPGTRCISPPPPSSPFSESPFFFSATTANEVPPERALSKLPPPLGVPAPLAACAGAGLCVGYQKVARVYRVSEDCIIGPIHVVCRPRKMCGPKCVYGINSIRAHVCAGYQKVVCVLLHGVACIFSHPTHPTMGLLYSAEYVRKSTQVYVGCQKVECVPVYNIVCIFSHPTHLSTRPSSCAEDSSNPHRCM